MTIANCTTIISYPFFSEHKQRKTIKINGTVNVVHYSLLDSNYQ